MDTNTFHSFTVFFANVHTLCVFVQVSAAAEQAAYMGVCSCVGKQ